MDQREEKKHRKEAEPDDRKNPLVEERHLRGHERHGAASASMFASAFTGARQQPVVKALSEHAECVQIGFEQRLLLLALVDILFA